MRRYSKWMFASSLLIFLVALTIFSIPHAPTERLDYAKGPPPMPPWEFDSLMLVFLAVVAGLAAVGLWKKDLSAKDIDSRRVPKALVYGTAVIAAFEFSLWVPLAITDWNVTFGTGFGDFDILPASFWNSFRPLFFSIFWTALVWHWKSYRRTSKIVAGFAGAVAIFSYLVSYQEFYFAYLNFYDFGGEFNFVSYWSSGNWDVIRACLLVMLLGAWAFRGLRNGRETGFCGV